MALDRTLQPPIFPVELEREIFEMTAYSRPLSIPTLMLVTSRVKLWVEPLLYQIIASDGPDSTTVAGHPNLRWPTVVVLMQSKPPSFFHNSIRHLLLCDVQVKQSEFLLNNCHRVENLFILSRQLASSLSAIGSLPLKRLYCHLTKLFGSAVQIDFTHRIFSQITHLQLFDYVDSVDIWSGLALIPHLTHIALFPGSYFIPLCLQLLNTCTSLRVIVIIEVVHGVPHDVRLQQLAEDDRFVCIRAVLMGFEANWYVGAHTGTISGREQKISFPSGDLAKSRLCSISSKAKRKQSLSALRALTRPAYVVHPIHYLVMRDT
ncbi:hypothetical protein B0H13DRAFT_2648817 [Mycena leptocephala]|nr:hypothetical protein B0H13DRAFT_2648817 [Mycena leptocephala]